MHFEQNDDGIEIVVDDTDIHHLESGQKGELSPGIVILADDETAKGGSVKIAIPTFLRVSSPQARIERSRLTVDLTSVELPILIAGAEINNKSPKSPFGSPGYIAVRSAQKDGIRKPA